MATDPNSLLLAASIFGGMFDPKHREEMRRRELEWQKRHGMVMSGAGVMVPKTVPQTFDPNQGGDETNLGYAARRTFQAPADFIAGLFDKPVAAAGRVQADMRQGARELVSTPNERARQQQSAGGNPFAKSFADPSYDAADANAARITGVPAALIRAVRMRGERTNAGVTSAAGANTPYQIIPETRQGIIKNYGIDPWKNPENAALGAAYVLREQAGNPGPKDWNQQLATRAVGGYFGGAAGAANPFSTTHKDVNGQDVGGYVQRVLGPNTDLPAPFLNPYDPSYDQQAMAMLAAGRQAALTPQTFSTNVGPAPEMPRPEQAPMTDFSKADAALEAMKPLEMSEKEKLRRERTGFWGGLAQGLMRSSGNEGIGTLLMKMGAGALGGRMQAKDDIEKEMDSFDDKMARFNAAVYQNEMGKAQTIHQEAAQQVAQNNEYNKQNWGVKYNSWLKNGNIDISGTNAVIQQRNDSTGEVSVRTIPIASAVNAAFANQAANLFSSMGGRNMAGQQQITGMTNAIIGQRSIQAMSGSNQSEADAGAAAAPAFYGTFIAQNGLTADLLGPDGAKSLEESVNKTLMGMQLAPGSKEWVDRRDRLVATELAKLGLKDPSMMQKMIAVGQPAGSFQALDDVQSRKTASSTDSRGRTTRRTTMNASDIFTQDQDPEFNQQLANVGYVRR